MVIHSVKVHSITIDQPIKHRFEIALTFKIGKYITRTFLKMLLPIEMQFDNKFIYGKDSPLPVQK
jgi:hypothetical protein